MTNTKWILSFIIVSFLFVSCSKSSNSSNSKPPSDTTVNNNNTDSQFVAQWIFFDTAHQNPFITDNYTADPSAHVWSDGRLYVYPSHDIPPGNGCNWMDKYHVYSTDDMVNWKDEGEILNASQVPGGTPEGTFMWAPDCAYKNGTYYFYFPHAVDSPWNSNWKIGVA